MRGGCARLGGRLALQAARPGLPLHLQRWSLPARGCAVGATGWGWGGPQEAGGSGEAERGRLLGKGSLLSSPQEASVPRQASPSRGQTLHSPPSKRPAGRRRAGASGRKRLAQPGPCSSGARGSASTCGAQAGREVRSLRVRGLPAPGARAGGHGGSGLRGPRHSGPGAAAGTGARPRAPLGPPRARSSLPGGGVCGANLSVPGAFLGLVAFWGGLGSAGLGPRPPAPVPAGSGGGKGSGRGSRRA